MKLRIIIRRGAAVPRVKTTHVGSQTTIQDIINDHLTMTTFTDAVLVVGPKISPDTKVPPNQKTTDDVRELIARGMASAASS